MPAICGVWPGIYALHVTFLTTIFFLTYAAYFDTFRNIEFLLSKEIK